MSREQNLSYRQICGAYTLLGHELQQSKLLNEKWQPVKRKELGNVSPLDIELVALFRMMEGYALRYGISLAEKAYGDTAEAIELLPEEEKYCNTTLASVYLFSFNTIALSIHMKQAQRSIDGLVEAILAKEGKELLLHQQII